MTLKQWGLVVVAVLALVLAALGFGYWHGRSVEQRHQATIALQAAVEHAQAVHALAAQYTADTTRLRAALTRWQQLKQQARVVTVPVSVPLKPRDDPVPPDTTPSLPVVIAVADSVVTACREAQLACERRAALADSDNVVLRASLLQLRRDSVTLVTALDRERGKPKVTLFRTIKTGLMGYAVLRGAEALLSVFSVLK